MNAEDADRRMHWLRLAKELGQEDDFRALMDDLRQEGAAGLHVDREALARIDWALRSGSGMTVANVAFGVLCRQLGVKRDSLDIVEEARREAER